MADNILDSYFVKVAALPDASSFLKLGNTLKDTELSIGGLTTKAVVSLAKFETASLGVFSAIGVGLISLADKTAMTDQSYRLMGLRFLMTKSSARSMQLALDELGATIDEVAYDPELNKRFQFLYEYNQKLGKTLGTNFDRNMQSIRDLRMEYKMFGTEFEFLVGGVISKLFDKVGLGSDNVLNKLQSMNDWFTNNLPEISDRVSSGLVPAWQDFKAVVKDAGGEFKTAAGDFTYLTGILTGDKSIQSTEFDVNNLTAAFVHWVDILAEATLSVQLLGKIGLHTFTGLSAAVAGYWQALQGNYSDTNRLWSTAHKEIDAAGKDVKDLFTGSNGEWKKNPDFSGILQHEEDKANRPYTPTTRNPQTGESIQSYLYPGTVPQDPRDIFGGSESSPQSLAYLVSKFGQQYNLNPELLAAIIHQESGGAPGAMSPKGAQGLMQLMPDTAKQYGVTNPFNPEQSIEGGAHYLSDLLKKYNGDTTKALAAYNAGPGNVDKYGGVPPFQETQDYVTRVLKEFSTLYQASQASGDQVIIDNVTIQVPHNLPEQDWHRFVHDSMSDIIDKKARNTMAQTAGGAFF